MNVSKSQKTMFGKVMTAGVAALSLGAVTLAASEPASAQFRGGGGGVFRPHGGFGGGGFGRGGFGGGYGRGGYGGFHRGYGGGYGRGLGYGLGGLGVGLALGGLYGGYGYGSYGGYGGGYYGAGYGGYGGGYGGYDGCLRRVWGPYGAHLVNVCY